MGFRIFRLKMHRRLRKGQRHVEGIGSQAEQSIEKHIFKRFNRLKGVKRFVSAWLFLLIALISAVTIQNISLSGYYQTLRPIPGGIYTEGSVGTFSGANPLYATGDVDQTVSRLIFAGLFTYDSDNQLVGNLASSYEVDAKGSTYTVHLKPKLTWHDGKPLTSEDVLYTYQSIQNPDAQSPLLSSWKGITITAPDPLTVVFKLPSGLASFPYTMTNGIVPKHILSKFSPGQLRTADFNTVSPIGAGPFKWQTIEVSGTDATNAEQQIALLPFDDYALGEPKISQFIVHAFADEKQLIRAFEDGKVKSMHGLSQLPKGIERDIVKEHTLLFTAGTYVFFKTTEGVLVNQPVRQALVRATDNDAIIKQLGYTTRSVKSPLLTGQQGHDPAFNQAEYDLTAAKALLDKDGWVMGQDGVRRKDKTPLTFSLTAADTPEYRRVTKMLKEQWEQLGVKLDVLLQGGSELQLNLSKHTYEAVLYGISIGQDPDVFVYWNSSQAEVLSANRLNFSEYKNSAADNALEGGRTRLDKDIRAVKYRPFYQAWQQDAPAVGLYQPRLLYITKEDVYGLEEQVINTATDRFSNVHNWQIRQSRVTN